MAVSRNKKIIIGAGAVVVIGVVSGVSVSRRSDLPEVQTAKVERRATLEAKVTANGEVRPIQFINLTSEVQGRVTDVFVKEGDEVKKGKPLLRVDPTQLASMTSVQEAGLRAQQAEVQNQVAAMTTAENAVNTAPGPLTTPPGRPGTARISSATTPRSNSNALRICLKPAFSTVQNTIPPRCVSTPPWPQSTRLAPASNRRRSRSGTLRFASIRPKRRLKRRRLARRSSR